MSTSLLVIPAFDSIAGLSNRHLNSNRGSQTEGLDSLCQRLGPRLPWTNYGRDKLSFVGCLDSEPRLALSHIEVMRRLSGA